MATLEEQITALEAARAHGVLRTRFGDEEVWFGSAEDMERRLASLRRQLNGVRTHRLASTSKGLG